MLKNELIELREDFSTPASSWNAMGLKPLHAEITAYNQEQGASIEASGSGSSWCTSQQSHCNTYTSNCSSMGSHCNSRASWCNPTHEP